MFRDKNYGRVLQTGVIRFFEINFVIYVAGGWLMLFTPSPTTSCYPVDKNTYLGP